MSEVCAVAIRLSASSANPVGTSELEDDPIDARDWEVVDFLARTFLS